MLCLSRALIIIQHCKAIQNVWMSRRQHVLLQKAQMSNGDVEKILLLRVVATITARAPATLLGTKQR